MLLTRSPLEYPQAGLSVRLACVKHAASVRPEPGSNSPLNAYRQTPKGHCQQNEEHPTPTTKAARTERDHSPKHEQTLANLKQQKQHQSSTRQAHHHKGSTQPQHQTNGTDFRYTVEFSKNGHTPAAAFRPPWGQPCKHYRVRSAVSNCPAPSPLSAGGAGAQSNTPRGGPAGDRRSPARRTVAARLGEQYVPRTGVSNGLRTHSSRCCGQDALGQEVVGAADSLPNTGGRGPVGWYAMAVARSVPRMVPSE